MELNINGTTESLDASTSKSRSTGDAQDLVLFEVFSGCAELTRAFSALALKMHHCIVLSGIKHAFVALVTAQAEGVTRPSILIGALVVTTII